jgi:hypothetical protein
MWLWPPTRARTRRDAAFGAFRMKQLNVWPLLILLIVILYLVFQLRPHG